MVTRRYAGSAGCGALCVCGVVLASSADAPELPLPASSSGVAAPLIALVSDEEPPAMLARNRGVWMDAMLAPVGTGGEEEGEDASFVYPERLVERAVGRHRADQAFVGGGSGGGAGAATADAVVDADEHGPFSARPLSGVLCAEDRAFVEARSRAAAEAVAAARPTGPKRARTLAPRARSEA